MNQTKEKLVPVASILSREQFEALRVNKAHEMAKDGELQKDALNVLVGGIQHHWIHQTTWMGEPVLQLPQDLFSIQEIIFKARPKYIIEIGTAWAGSLLFYSTLLEFLGGESVIGVDIFIPDDLKTRIKNAGRVSDKIRLLEASSVEQSTIDKIKKIIGDSKSVMVHLDSDHTHSHVLKELKLYSQFIGPGNYLICGDTHVERIPANTHGDKPYGPGNNPKTALDEFMSLPEGKTFEIDTQYEDKYLFSLNPGGYLRRK